MNTETKYSYEKRIKELHERVRVLENHLYEFRTACSEIYDGAIEAAVKGSTVMNIAYVLGRLKRCWVKL